MSDLPPMDPISNLPDEILCHLLSKIRSPCSKLQLLAVNYKFRRCVATLFRIQSHSLVLDFVNKTLSGDALPMDRWPQVVELLTRMTKFSEIRIIGYCYPHAYPWLDPTLTVLCQAPSECLDGVKRFEGNIIGEPQILASLLAKCTNVSVVRLHDFCNLDLRAVLKDRGLKELKMIADHDNLEYLFRNLKPNRLRKVDFVSTNLGGLASRLRNSAWAALDEIRLTCWDLPIAQLRQIFTQLPALTQLQHCSINVKDDNCLKANEFIPALVPLFRHSRQEKPLKIDFTASQVNRCSLPNFIELFGQVQRTHPTLAVDVGPHNLTFSLGNISLVTGQFVGRHCFDDSCVPCRSFYPIVLDRLHKNIFAQQSLHLENYYIPRCKIGQVVSDMKKWKAREIQMDEEQEKVKITFECFFKTAECFNVTIDCSNCFNDSCVLCRLAVI